MEPLFSLISIVGEGRHLLSLTLDALRGQSDKRFEVILFDALDSGRIEEIAKPYSDLNISVFRSSGKTTSEMMNEAIQKSKGKYIQFLSPGDRYLSQDGISYLSDQAEAHQEPQLIYSGFVLLGMEAVQFPLDRSTLQKGMFTRDCWFSKRAILDLGGLDPALTYRSAFDLLCRLFLHQGMRSICSRRIVTDGEPKVNHPRAMMGYVFETYQILYRHFGLWS